MGSSELNFQSLIQSYISAVTKPNAATYEAEVGNASWIKVGIGLLAVAIVSTIMSLLSGAAARSQLNQFQSQFGSQFDVNQYSGLINAGSDPAWAFVGPLITFFIGAGLLYILARLFGGQGGNFMVHSYLLSISYTPLRVVASVLSIIPCVGLIFNIAQFLYQLYLAGLAMQVSQRMAPGRAQAAAFVGLGIGIVLGCLCAVAITALGIAAFSSLNDSNP